MEIVVCDTGLGFPPEVKDKLFQPFYTTKVGGTGVGLSVSQAIIHNLGGEISAQNHPEGGAFFSILLPSKAYVNSVINKIDVLLITNDEMLRLPIEQVLGAENIDVITVNNKDNAMFMLNRCLPSVIITEAAIISPQNYENIKKKFPTIRVLIAGEEDNYNGLEDVCFIPKPLNYAKFISKIKSLL